MARLRLGLRMGHKSGTLTATSGHSRALHPGWPYFGLIGVTGLRAAKWYPAVPGSGDKQAKAKLCRLEIDEVAVAFGPST
jgi:hypothetical protein